jgi:hypothetical protein
VQEPIVRIWHREVIKLKETDILIYLEPQQMMLSPAWAAKLVNAVRMMLEMCPDFVSVQIDLNIALNTCTTPSGLAGRKTWAPHMVHRQVGRMGGGEVDREVTYQMLSRNFRSNLLLIHIPSNEHKKCKGAFATENHFSFLFPAY